MSEAAVAAAADARRTMNELLPGATSSVATIVDTASALASALGRPAVDSTMLLAGAVLYGAPMKAGPHPHGCKLLAEALGGVPALERVIGGAVPAKLPTAGALPLDADGAAVLEDAAVYVRATASSGATADHLLSALLFPRRPRRVSRLVDFDRSAFGADLFAGLEEQRLDAAALEEWRAILVPDFVRPYADSDQPRGPDQLDHDRYAAALLEVLTSEKTKPPLVVGLYGSWGSGKSFLMNKMREQLARVANDELVYLPVEFNAWVYSASENLWAGLITRLYDEVERHLGFFPPFVARISERVPRLLAAAAFYIVAIAAFAGAVALAVHYGRTDLFGDVGDAWANSAHAVYAVLVGGGSLMAAVATVPPLVRVMRELAAKVGDRSKQLRALASRPDFRDKIGFMADVQKEVETLSKMLREPRKGKSTRVFVFIDDLDRCPPAKAVEVLEAIMLLLADHEKAPYVVVLGLDARVLVRAVEVKYGEVFSEAGITGYEYLDKLVQIPFRVPSSDATTIQGFVASLTGYERRAEDRASGTRAVADRAAATSAPAIHPAQRARHDAPARARREVPFEASEQRAFDAYAGFVSKNPRRVKRMVNVYRVVRVLRGVASAEQRAKDVKWTLLCEEWPFRIALLLDGLEGADPTDSLRKAFARLPREALARHADAIALTDGDGEQFEALLDAEPPLVVADVAALHAVSINLNPAVEREVTAAAVRARLPSPLGPDDRVL